MCMNNLCCMGVHLKYCTNALLNVMYKQYMLSSIFFIEVCHLIKPQPPFEVNSLKKMAVWWNI